MKCQFCGIKIKAIENYIKHHYLGYICSECRKSDHVKKLINKYDNDTIIEVDEEFFKESKRLESESKRVDKLQQEMKASTKALNKYIRQGNMSLARQAFDNVEYLKILLYAIEDNKGVWYGKDLYKKTGWKNFR